jgi:RNA polymerase sigma-70 factor, ECF subfamily
MRDAHQFSSASIDGAKIRATSNDMPEQRIAGVVGVDQVPGLVQRAQEGDKDAFGQLYRLHHAQVFRLVRVRLGEDADDVTSDIFLRAWAALPRYQSTAAPFVAWLYGIARHVVADEFRRRKRTAPVAEVPEAGVEFHEDERLAISEAMARLPDTQRQIVEMKFLMGLRNPEVAAALGITVGAVNAKQWRALKALRDFLEGSA